LRRDKLPKSIGGRGGEDQNRLVGFDFGSQNRQIDGADLLELSRHAARGLGPRVAHHAKVKASGLDPGATG
jgi:hypothetical protein